MSEKFRVYDDRDNSTIFEGTKLQCANYLHEQLGTKNSSYLWLERTEG